jgi:Zn-dependent metalloprotease
MTERLSKLTAALPALAVSVALLTHPALAAPLRTPDPAAGGALAALDAAAGAAAKRSISRTTGLATFVAAPAGAAFPTGLSYRETAEGRARAFLERYGGAFGILDSNQLVLRRSPSLDSLGMEHVRLRQTHNGVPVTGGEISVHLRGNGVVAVNARTLADLDGISTIPTVLPYEAAATARTEIARALGVTDFSLTEPRLELFNRGLLEDRVTTTRLAWFVEARSLDLRQYVWIDAESGSVLLRFSQLPHALYREVYDAEDPLDGVYGELDLPGTLCRTEGEGAFGDADVDFAFTWTGDTWEYFWSEHGRDSYDNAGATLASTVHYCPNAGSCPFPNAYWHSGDPDANPPILPQMIYGDGYPAADDVTAHEITHAVIEHTADLFYYMQSGALSESYADVFGEAVDLTNGAGTDDSGVRWLLGEDRPCANPTPGACASRDMMDPTLFGDPAWTGDWRFVCDDPGDDGGGVHSNSGVPNHAFALLVDGGVFNGIVVDGIGLAAAGRIYYRALAHYLLSASNFTDHAAALRQSCLDLVGTPGIGPAECGQIEASLDAVRLDQPWPCESLSPTADALCSTDAISSTYFSDDFESSPTGTWATSTPLGENVWGWGHDFATSGRSHLRGNLLPHCTDASTDLSTDSSVEMSTDVPIPPAGAYLQFTHAFGFENYSYYDTRDYYDGGVLEYSVDGGTSWADAGSLITAGAAYGGILESGFGNPLGGRRGFVGDSWGYTASQADISPLANQSVRFRFRIGADESTDFCDYGWFVDDVLVYTCPDSCVAMPASGCLDCLPALSLASGGAVQSVETWVGCDSIHAGGDFGIGSAGRGTMIAPLVTLGDGFFVDQSGELAVRTE